MPLYRFVCLDCILEFEKIMTISEKYSPDNKILCPQCGSEENKPLISKTSFSLKGSGWYKDGYEKKET